MLTQAQKKKNEAIRAWQKKNPDRVRAAINRWRKTEKYRCWLKKYQKANKTRLNEAAARYRAKHPDRVRANYARWREKNKQAALDNTKRWRQRNKKKNYSTQRRWKAKNTERVRAYNARASVKRLSTISGRLNNRMASAIRESLGRGCKGRRRWEVLVGYTAEELQRHLERNFLPGMSWKNRGRWHIDHVIPLSAWKFDGPNHPAFRAAWALKNLRPLWAKDNMKKYTRLPTPEDLRAVKWQ